MNKREVTEDEILSARQVFMDNPGISNQCATDLLARLGSPRSWYGCYHLIRVASQRLRGEAEAKARVHAGQ